MVQSKSLIFAKIPSGFPVPGQDLKVKSVEVDISKAPEGGVVLQVLQVSVDPYMRGCLREAHVKSYNSPFEIGKPIYGEGLGKVIESSNDSLPKGAIVKGPIDHSEYVVYGLTRQNCLSLFKTLTTSHCSGF